jgi:hypothetical protein
MPQLSRWLLALANGHGRYTRTGTCVRWGMAVAYKFYKFVTVFLLKRLRSGIFTYEAFRPTTNRRLDPEVF